MVMVVVVNALKAVEEDEDNEQMRVSTLMLAEEKGEGRSKTRREKMRSGGFGIKAQTDR